MTFLNSEHPSCIKSDIYKGGSTRFQFFCSILTEYGKTTLYRNIYTEIVLNDYA